MLPRPPGIPNDRIAVAAAPPQQHGGGGDGGGGASVATGHHNTAAAPSSAAPAAATTSPPPQHPPQHPPQIVRVNRLLRFLDVVCAEASRRYVRASLSLIHGGGNGCGGGRVAMVGVVVNGRVVVVKPIDPLPRTPVTSFTRCTMRAREKVQEFVIRDSDLHLPSRVCVDPQPNGMDDSDTISTFLSGRTL